MKRTRAQTRKTRNGTRRPAARSSRRLWLELLEAREVMSGFTTPAPSYLDAVAPGVTVTPLLTAGDIVPRTGSATQQYRMAGIPDGLGATAVIDGTVQLFMNHEMTENRNPSVPVVGGTAYPQTQNGAFVSKYILDPKDASIRSGDLAYTTIVRGSDTAAIVPGVTPLDPADPSGPKYGSFSRFCSGFLGGPDVGLDRYIYFAGEETGAASTLDRKGGQAVAIFDGVAHILPELSHFAKENVIVVPGTGDKTVMLSMEDAGALTSQLYMYVGTKDPSSSDPLVKNGLIGGKLYVLSAPLNDRGQHLGEDKFHKGDGAVTVYWSEVPNPASLDDTQLEAVSQGLNSVNFVRIEDGTYDRQQAGVFYFITTGAGAESPTNPNSLGRLTKLTFDPTNPATGPASLTVLLEGDRGDPLVNPDNIDVNAQGQMIILEDPNDPEHNGPGFWNTDRYGGRDSSVFLYDIHTGALVRLAQINRAAAAASVNDNPGVQGSWETSGVIDVSAVYGTGAWMLDVQAHTLFNDRTGPNAAFNALVGFEGGQLLMLRTDQPLVTVQYPQENVRKDGTLVVLGTPGHDDIKVLRQGDTVIVRFNGADLGAFDLATLKDIKINGYAGDDVIEVAADVPLDATIYGGEGTDRLTGGGGHNRLDGGPGSDTLVGRGAGNVYVLKAGEGTDTVLNFQDGKDRVELAGGLTYSDLAVSRQGGDTVVGVDRPVLVGQAILPADTFAPGPVSGQFITAANGRTPPFDSQPVQGFSAVLKQADGSFLAMPDNGYGAKNNSADFLLRVYRITPDFVTPTGGTGAVEVAPYFTLRDPDRKIPFTIVADRNTYYANSTVPVDPQIRANRWLTGADFDLESFRRAKDGTFWFGEEFGPFILHTDATGKVLDAPFPLPGVRSPDSPYLGGNTPNLPSSRGFEGMALNASGTKLYALLEGALTTDPDQHRLIINEFSLAAKQFTGKRWYYRMEDTTASGQSIGDMTAINDHEFLVIERDNNQGDAAKFKKIFKIDINQVDAAGFVHKEEVADLLNIADPNNLSGNGTGKFTFPYVTIESVDILDAQTLVVLNDNNYPFSAGRTPNESDSNEVILIHLGKPLDLPGSPAPSKVDGSSSLILKGVDVDTVSVADFISTARRPLIIGHRGEAGLRPEHTLESYRQAIADGADFVEPDLVLTKDGVLIARHEPNITDTTNVADHPEFADRKRTVAKGNAVTIDGTVEEGWFAFDFTLAEIKTLRAKERLPFRDHQFDGLYEVPTLQEIINFVKSREAALNRTIGIYPETKHPTFHAQILPQFDMNRLLVDTLESNGYHGPHASVFIQSFEVSNLKAIRQMTDLPIIQLYDALDIRPDGTLIYNQPYDFVVSGDPRTYGDLLTPAGLAEVAGYATGIGPWKRMIVSVDANNFLVKPTSLVKDAHAAGLLVHPYTFRDEDRYLAADYAGDPRLEYEQFFALGVDGLFTDFARTARPVADRLYPYNGPDFSQGAGLLASLNRDPVRLPPVQATTPTSEDGGDSSGGDDGGRGGRERRHGADSTEHERGEGSRDHERGGGSKSRRHSARTGDEADANLVNGLTQDHKSAEGRGQSPRPDADGSRDKKGHPSANSGHGQKGSASTRGQDFVFAGIGDDGSEWSADRLLTELATLKVRHGRR
jgi:glycerophosphoryl diester phosphodiesterase